MSRKPVPFELDPDRLPEVGATHAPAAIDSERPVGTGGPGTTMLHRLVLAIWRYKWMVLAISAVGIAAGIVTVRFQRLTYETRARIWIQGAGASPSPIRQATLFDDTGWQNLLRSSAVIDTVVSRRKMYLTLSRPADSLMFAEFGLDRTRLLPGKYRLALDENGHGFILSDERGQTLQRGAFGDSAGVGVGFLWVPKRSLMPSDRPVEFAVRAPGDVATQLSRDLDIRPSGAPGRGDTFLAISLRGQDRYAITATLEAVIARFDTVALNLKKAKLVAQNDILNQQLQEADRILTDHEAALKNFQIETATQPMELRAPGVPLAAGLANTDGTIYGNFFQLNTEKDQYLRDQQTIRTALVEHAGTARLITALEVIPSVQTSTELKLALQEAAGTAAKLRALLVDFTEEHPEVKRTAAYLDTLYRAVIPGAAQTLLVDLDARITQRDAQIEALAAELRQIPERQIEQEMLQRQRDIADQLYRDLERSYQTQKLAEVTTVPDLTIVDRPNVPYTPVADERRRMLLMFLAGSIGLALGAAILRDRLDARVQYPDQVTAGLGLNILGAVPALGDGRLGPNDMALAVEAFRSIQLSLAHAIANGGPIMATFSSPGAADGKSFVTSNLAIAFADMGHRTLVIDGDVRRGTIHKLLNAHHKPGLTDFLAGRVDRAAIVRPTQYPLLDFIPCGSRQESGPRLLGSPAMRQLMRDLRANYDVILVDSPPLGACVDPMILATLTTNLVLVVRTGATNRTVAESKLDMLDRLPVRVVGAVLNDVTQSGPYRYYSYVSGYEILEDETRTLAPAATAAENGGAPAGPGEDGDDAEGRSREAS